MALTNDLRSATLVRSESARSASARPLPICISRSTRANSSASGPSVLRATCWTAASKPRPDSTLIVIRSMASASARCTSVGSVVGALVEVEVRGEEAEHQTGEQGHDAKGNRRPHHDGQGRTDDAEGYGTDDLERDDPVDGPVARVAGQVELVAYPLGRVRAGQPPAECQGPSLQGPEYPVVERLVQLRPHLRGGLRHRLQGRDRAVEALGGLGVAERHAHHQDSQQYQQDAEHEDHRHLTPRP